MGGRVTVTHLGMSNKPSNKVSIFVVHGGGVWAHSMDLQGGQVARVLIVTAWGGFICEK